MSGHSSASCWHIGPTVGEWPARLIFVSIYCSLDVDWLVVLYNPFLFVSYLLKKMLINSFEICILTSLNSTAIISCCMYCLYDIVCLDLDSNLTYKAHIQQVHKSGSFGRSLDISKFSSYHELRSELARLFGLEGELEDPVRSGWQLVFVDCENDVLLLGDDPWQ